MTVTLDDRYELNEGRVYLTGVQALVRLLLVQRRLDAAAGLDTAGFVSGYRGSPLGTIDQELWRSAKHLDRHQIVFQPGLNEELAATSVWGTQQVGLFPGARYDGVFGMWYAKSPGVDRSGDVLKHANAAGTSPLGGVLAIAGDDHACKSASLPSQSDYAFMDASIPVLHPADVGEVLRFGLIGWAMSRASGLWVGMKALADTMDSARSIDLSGVMPSIVQPVGIARDVHIRLPDSPLEQERRLFDVRLPAAISFARANGLNRIIVDPDHRQMMMVVVGKSLPDVQQALARLGLDVADMKRLGLGLAAVGMPWPLDPEFAGKVCRNAREVLVVEEKRPLVEDQLARMAFNLPARQRPQLVGKTDRTGRPLLSAKAAFSVDELARVIFERIEALGLPTDEIVRPRARATEPAALLARLPYFCSGCPHNRSTKIPEGSRGLAGIGCHYMVQWMDRDTSTFTQMGGEGTSWIGQAPFTSRAHVFVNLGDGTYAHSGILAIRAARSAGVNITYQILYNDAVAMTGGQNAEGGFTPLDIIRQLRAEGIDAIALVAEEPERYLNVPLPEGVTLDGRDAHEAVQRRLREVSGVSVILFDQVCAAEKRRRRKRGLMPASTRFAMINEAVCEGCGDCGIKSNCVSLVPVETALGRKRAVDQSSCNQDLSCVDGFCPSFVTIEGAVRRSGRAGADVPRPPVTPLPTADPDGRTAIVIGGIGGTGVVTVGALIGMAAHLEAKGVAILDQIGLAQKGGEVSSHIQIARRPEDIGPVRLTAGEADLLIGCDLVVAANPSILALLTPTALAIVNSHATMTSQFTSNPELTFPGEELLERIRSRARVVSFDLAEIATRIFGDSTAANILALGMAWQTGRIPLRLESIERAIALNGTAVASNTSAFHWGRALAYSPDAALTRLNPDRTPARPQTLDEQIAYRRKHLAAYQDDQLADRFARLVQKVRTAEERTVPGQTALTASVCHTYHRLLAIKDEYEVARLMRSPAFKDAIKSEFEGGRVFYHLAPPILGKRDPLTGQLLKRKFGPSVQIVFALLERLKILRGTPLDVFSYMEERRVERALIGEFESVMEEVVLALTPELHQVSVDLVDSFGRIRGYGHVKASSIRAARERIDALRLELRQIARPASPVASSIVNGEPRVAGHA